METSNKDTVIGKVFLSYNEDGSLLAAAFSPKISVSAKELFDQLGTCTNKSEDQIQQTAQLLLASFFNKITAIELRDMETTDIEAKVVNSERYTATADIKEIEIDFIYKEK